jgi:hypothetical protein
MALSITTVALLQREIIANLDKVTVIRPFANHKYEGELKRQGSTVTVESLGDVTWNRGGTAGAAITAGTLTVTNYDLTVNECDQVNIPVADITKIQYNRDAQADVSSRMSVALGQIMDRYTAQLAAINASTKNVTAITVSASNAYATVARLKTDLRKKNVPLEGVGLFVNPEVENFLVQASEWDATERGVDFRVNGLIGRLSGMPVYVSNNLPHVRVVTMPTIPVAGDTMEIGGVTFTWRANGGANAAGDISIGANVAASKVNFVDAINGTGTAGASTYIAVSAADRLLLKNAFVKATTFSGNVSRVYSADTLAFTEVVTPADFTIAADAAIIFAMDRDAVNVADQMTEMASRDQVDAFTTNLLGEYVYGGAVLGRNADRIATYDVTNV